MRYGGRGVMIYWYVERNSLCIHSQLKSASSSEVASMIEEVVHHCTEIEVERQYVDSHGQSTIAFAFCRLLGFQLMPRLKAIPVQKLSRPDAGRADAYPNLQTILTKPIDWELIRQQYDQLVKYVTAVRLGTAETEAILRRFVRSNIQHPTYKAFAELGKAVKTFFLCRYLHSESDARSTRASTSSSNGTAPTISSSSPAAAKWSAIAAKITKSVCSPCICSRIAWCISTP
jgi:TnpA family transposase